MAEAHPPAKGDETHAAPGDGELNAVTEDHGGGHAEPTALGLAADGWVAMAMLVLFALMIWKGVPAAIGRALDRKIAGIRQQLDEAAQLRAEAAGIISQAESDAAALVERRTRMAEDKIGAAERAALDQVRARAASVAAAAAERLIRERLDAGVDKALVDATIAELGQR
jgi:F-type H+-transporting ATPase subunit b